MLKSGHHCAIKIWKRSSLELGEDKEGIQIRVERLDCDRTAWEDSGLPSLRMESQVNLGRKYYSATTNRHWATKTGSL